MIEQLESMPRWVGAAMLGAGLALACLAACACWRWWRALPSRFDELDAILAEPERPTKPTPYASKLPSGTGSAPEAPWAALDAHRDLEARVAALEDMIGERLYADEWAAEVNRTNARLNALEAKRGAWRGWKCNGMDYVYDGTKVWWRWSDGRGWGDNECVGPFIAVMDQRQPRTELHGPELDALVAEFEAWQKGQG